MSFNLSRPGDDTVRQRPLFVPGIGSDDPYSDAWLPERDISRTHSEFRSSQVQNIQQTEKEDDELSKSSPRDKREMEKEKDTRGRETNDKENTNAAAASPRARSQSVRSGYLQGSPTSRPPKPE
ncbi:hypothetical protein BT96DRAFT_297712 [Gymnopus androsaceus JB14]|uniref:Uncharacterized protein n=1 Tax=Gymnopus androsaceus JB14 TaxID=1447944 RepID=A0A6A4H287_9AGAR|nr:hypothetical protein BT96DRAFT_297712 [Gymnopus androsaceus JB14]